jgi:hypothetical protein
VTFRIADTFTAALAKLSSTDQKAAKTAAFDLQMNPAHPALSLHRVDRAKDRDFWTARASSDIRLVLHKRGDDTLLTFVGHHDDAYAWAERRRIDVHPRTGAAQIVEIRETIKDVIIQRYVDEAVRKPRRFADESDDMLLSWGVPQDWLSTVRNATEDTVLDIAGHLPAEAGEAILNAATGTRPEPAPVSADPYAHPDAARRFRVMENQEELAAALDAPWEKWAVFLHPAQREFVTRNFNGPARIIGSAGTGKTVVALHRAVRFARDSADAKVLLATFNATLAEALDRKLVHLAGPEPRSRIKAGALQAVLDGLHHDAFGETQIASEDEVVQALSAAAKSEGVKISPEFLTDEWHLVVDAWDVSDMDAYRELPRLGRKVRMAASRRDALWAVFAQTRALLYAQGLRTRASTYHELAQSYRDGAPTPYTHVLVDEAQDISVAELHLLAAIAGARPNGLFFAGDIGQRIFRAPFPWKLAGVEVQGRSRSLKVNYRTSHQIRAQSDRLLPASIVEADGSEDRRTGVVSVFEGPVPQIHEFSTEDAEIAGVAAWLGGLLSEGIRPQEVAILIRTNGQLRRAQMSCRGVEAERSFDTASIMIACMHDAKGSEYRAVAVIACDHDILPLEQRLLEARDEGMLDEIMATERHLLYVAVTRARERLWISGVTPISEFVQDLMDT